MVPKKINIGILGSSAIAERSTIPALLESGLFKLTAIGSRTPAKAERLALKFGCIGTSYVDVLNNSEIDAVYVPLPTGLHYEWGKKVLESGKHLLMEKPFADSYDRSLELIQYAASRKLVAMEGLTYVYHPLIKKVFELINGQQIGKVLFIDAFFGFPELPESDIRNNPSLGGGAILDNLIYPLSFALHLLNNVYEKIDFQIIASEKYGVDSRGFLRIDSGQATAHINYGFGFFYRNSFMVWGDKGTIEVDRAFTRPKDMQGEIVVKKEGQPVSTIVIEPANQFLETVKAFYNKVMGLDHSGVNESNDILSRMKLISEMYQSFIKK